MTVGVEKPLAEMSDFYLLTLCSHSISCREIALPDLVIE